MVIRARGHSWSQSFGSIKVSQHLDKPDKRAQHTESRSQLSDQVKGFFLTCPFFAPAYISRLPLLTLQVLEVFHQLQSWADFLIKRSSILVTSSSSASSPSDRAFLAMDIIIFHDIHKVVVLLFFKYHSESVGNFLYLFFRCCKSCCPESSTYNGRKRRVYLRRLREYLRG